MIATWWAGLDPANRILWGVTLVASLIFLVQTILTFLGADSDADFDSFDSDSVADLSDGGTGSNLYTFRNLVNFALGFGWSAILLQGSIKSTGLLMVVSVAVGIGLVALVMFIFRSLAKMQQSGTIDLAKSAVGCQGTCYLAIPPSRSGEGKVQISISGAIREYSAQTEEDAPIATGTPIKVSEVINDSTLLVETLDSTII